MTSRTFRTRLLKHRHLACALLKLLGNAFHRYWWNDIFTPRQRESLLKWHASYKNFAKAFESCNKKRATAITVSVFKHAIKRFARMCTHEGEFSKQVWEPSTSTRPLLIWPLSTAGYTRWYQCTATASRLAPLPPTRSTTERCRSLCLE